MTSNVSAPLSVHDRQWAAPAIAGVTDHVAASGRSSLRSSEGALHLHGVRFAETTARARPPARCCGKPPTWPVASRFLPVIICALGVLVGAQGLRALPSLTSHAEAPTVAQDSRSPAQFDGFAEGQSR